MIKAIIFDVDGTLLDSKENHIQAWKKAFTELGYDVPLIAIQGQFGRRKKETIEKFIPQKKWLSDGKKIIELKRKHFWQNFNSVKVFPETYNLINFLKRENIKIAIATSAKRDELDLYFQKLKIKDKVDFTITADDIKKSKPDPQTVQIVLNKLNLNPEETLLVGDSIHDIEAGKRAGVKTVGVLTGYTTKEQLNKSNADFVYSDIETFFKDINRFIT